MYGVKTVFLGFEHEILNVISKDLFYQFFKDVLDKTLTFEVPTLPKMEAENYKKKRFYKEKHNFGFWGVF